jgi:hypothetical protein
MAESFNRFLGDSPGRTIVKLIVASLVVGFLMRFFGIRPWDIVDQVRFFFLDLWYTGFDAFGQFGSYLMLGATVVLPLFILIRLLSLRR